MANQSNILKSIFSTAQPMDWDLIYQSELPRVYNYFLYKTGDRASPGLDRHDLRACLEAPLLLPF
jgi:hypothetical protein